MNYPEFSSLIKEYGNHMNWAEDTYEGLDNDYLSFYIKNLVYREYRNTEAPELHKASEKLLMLLPAPTNSKDACWRRLCHLYNRRK